MPLIDPDKADDLAEIQARINVLLARHEAAMSSKDFAEVTRLQQQISELDEQRNRIMG